MVESQVRSYVSNFTADKEDGPFINASSEKILSIDGINNIDNPREYAAGLTYIANIAMNSKFTQKEIAYSMGCSVESLRKEYRAIVERNREKLKAFFDVE